MRQHLFLRWEFFFSILEEGGGGECVEPGSRGSGARIICLKKVYKRRVEGIEPGSRV